MDYKHKYIKYKNKYLQLKHTKYIGGSDNKPFIENTIFDKYMYLQNKYKSNFNNIYNIYTINKNMCNINCSKYFSNMYLKNKFNKKIKKILKYNFIHEEESVNIINIINKYNINIDNISLIISNSIILEAILYLYEFKKYNTNYNNIYTYIINKATQSKEYTDILNNILQSKNLKNSKYDLKDFIKSKDNIMKDTIIIDYNNYDNNTNQLNILNIFHSSLKQLNKNGDIIIFIRIINSKYYYDIFNYIKIFFNKMELFSKNPNDLFIYIIYKDYKCIDNKQYTLLEDIIKGKKKVPITNEVEFLKFKNAILERERKVLNNYNIIEHILENNDNELLQEAFQNNLINKLKYYKNLGMGIVDWLDNDNIPLDYYNDKINDIYIDIKPKIFVVKKIKSIFELTDNITMKKEDYNKISELYNYKESIYEYSEDINKKNLKKTIELKQKNLQDVLKSKYNIRFNNKRVNRAWCKLYEMYKELHFFKNIKSNEIKMFFICEAPGMWVHSTIDYFKRHMKQKLNWKAQSLKSDIALKDHYSFMSKTKYNWDYATGDGDITKVKNLEYYKSKYGEFDCVLGDCGLPYMVEKKLDNFNLAIYQLLYNMYLLKRGGNFILKTYQINRNELFLSLLQYISNKFDKVYIFRSSRNFWSPEQYIVGIGFKGIDDISFIPKLMKNYKEGKPLYPIKNISTEFINDYTYYTKELITYYHMNMKFYFFLINNSGMMKLFNKNIDKIIQNQTNKWIRKYLL
jgi:hypothetical protein